MQYIIARKRFIRITNIPPTRLIVGSFATIILIGSILLDLPVSSKDGMSIGFVDSLFTATSATCVTGLVVVDTQTHWTLLGQLVILCLIQIGGLGLITLATFFSVLLGKKVSMKGKIAAQESISDYSFTEVVAMIKKIVLVTFSVELAGALLLAISFVPRYGAKGLYMSVFHSVSAFCNAGFDLTGGYRSLTQFTGDPVVIDTTALLIIIGGLGFIVWKNLYDYRETHVLYLHTKIVLIMTALLILLGTVSFFAFEYSNPLTMGHFTLFDKINAAFFQSVTTRTAGYNSLPLNDMKETSKILTILLMYIGAGPGSTAGGIKVTTVGILIMAIVCNIQGRDQTIIMKRRVDQKIVNKALTIAGLSMLLILIMTMAIISIENIRFIRVLYEVTSAFGTVGLSTGITPDLHSISKILLVFTMFLGRVGPLTFAVAIAMRSNNRIQNSVYPEGKIMVG